MKAIVMTQVQEKPDAEVGNVGPHCHDSSTPRDSTVEPRLSRLVGTSVNSPHNRESG